MSFFSDHQQNSPKFAGEWEPCGMLNTLSKIGPI